MKEADTAGAAAAPDEEGSKALSSKVQQMRFMRRTEGAGIAPVQQEEVKREVEVRKWRLTGNSGAATGDGAGQGGLHVVADPRVGDSDSGEEDRDDAGPTPADSGETAASRAQEALLAGRRTFRGFNRRLEGTLNEIESGVPARAEPMSTEEMADKLRRWESLRSEKGGRGGRGDRKRESPAESGSAGKRGARGGRQGEKGKKNKKKKKRRTS